MFKYIIEITIRDEMVAKLKFLLKYIFERGGGSFHWRPKSRLQMLSLVFVSSCAQLESQIKCKFYLEWLTFSSRVMALWLWKICRLHNFPYIFSFYPCGSWVDFGSRCVFSGEWFTGLKQTQVLILISHISIQPWENIHCRSLIL